MHYPDGNYRFQSGVKCTVRNNVVYVQNGDIIDFNIHPYAAAWLQPSMHGEDYSAWTDDDRAAKRKEIADAEAAAKAAEREKVARQTALADAALAKLTDEEREALAAIYDLYIDSYHDEPDYPDDCE